MTNKKQYNQVFDLSKRLLERSRNEQLFLPDLVLLRDCVNAAISSANLSGNGQFDQVCPVVESTSNFLYFCGESYAKRK